MTYDAQTMILQIGMTKIGPIDYKVAKQIMEIAKVRDKAVLALEAQALLSEIQRTRTAELPYPLPNDPRYTPFIGECDGYAAPEQRYHEFADKRRQLREEVLRESQ